MDLSELLPELEDRLRQRRVPIAEILLPGIGEDKVRKALRRLEMEPPEELVTGYAWHNGIAPGFPETFGQTLLNKYLLSLDEAIAEWGRLGPGLESWEWNPTWLPFLSSSGMPRFAVDCTPPQGDMAPVRMASPDAGLFDEKQHASMRDLSTVVSRWITALDEGWIVYLEDSEHWDDRGRAQIPLDWTLTGFI